MTNGHAFLQFIQIQYMYNEPSNPVTTARINKPSAPIPTGRTGRSNHTDRLFPSLSWKAIFGGVVAAIGIHLLLTTLGIGAGLATFSPMSDANPVSHFSAGAAIGWTICALVALGFGGLVAGRFSHSIHHGFVHGILVWSLTLIITLLLVSMGTGMILGGAMKVAGEGMGIGGNAAMGSDAKQAADQLSSFTDEAVQSLPVNSPPKATTRAKRGVGLAVTKLFAPGNDVNSPNNRAAAVKALVDYTQMSPADATKTVDDWTISYNDLKAELAQKADIAARNLSTAAIWSFFALLIGLVVAGLGGALGARFAMQHAYSHDEMR
jgi:hypothetical protein